MGNNSIRQLGESAHYISFIQVNYTFALINNFTAWLGSYYKNTTQIVDSQIPVFEQKSNDVNRSSSLNLL